MIKFKEIEIGTKFMFRSSGAATVYVALNVTKISECITEVLCEGVNSGRKSTFKKINSVRVLKFD